MMEKFLTGEGQNIHFNVPDHFNFAYDVVDAWASEAPDKLALLWTSATEPERRLTFADLKRESDKVAGYLSSLGIGRGDFVMLILKRRLAFWTTMLALEKIGAVAIPATYLLSSHDIIYRCKSAEIKAIICCGDADILAKVAEAEPKCPFLDRMISVGPVVPEGFEDFEAGVAAAEPWERNGFTNDSSDPMLMYFTSGTSDEPKMALHSHTYALSHLVTAAFWQQLTPDSLHFTYSDSGWAKAAWGKIYGQWIVGAAIFVYDHEKFFPAEILALIGKYRITSFCAPPTIYRFLIKEHFNCFDLSSLQSCSTAGEALNPSVFEEFHRRTGLWIHEGFGQSETSIILGTFRWVEPRPGSMGKPSPFYDIDLIKADGTPAGVGERGVISIRTGEKPPVGLFLGYYRNPKLTHKAWHDGIYSTGDVAYKDADGYYWFEGRNDDLIKTSGYRVSPFEVESAVMGHPAVLECAVTGVPDPDETRGTVVKATIVVASEYKKQTLDGISRSALIKDIQKYVKGITAPYKYPRVIEFVEELPKTVSGKIRHAELREKDARG